MSKVYIVMVNLISAANNLPMNPAGKVTSVLTFPSILINRCLTIFLTSSPFRAYLRRLRRNTMRGRHSRSLCGPCDGRGA